MIRRNFIKNIGFLGIGSSFTFPNDLEVPKTAVSDRNYWLNTMDKIIHPVLSNLSQGKLKKEMPVESAQGHEEGRKEVTYLEALGRTLTGIAPWLALSEVAGNEKSLQEKYITFSRESIKQAVTPGAADYMNFTKGGQPLVDAAFLAHALIKAPEVLWHPLDKDTKDNLLNALKSTRSITPGYNNWLLFAAMIEAFFLSIGEEWDGMRVDLSLKKHQEWYLGDGMYGDGEEFHWDYYNSYVIQPFLLDIVDVVASKTNKYQEYRNKLQQITQRYAEIQESLIAPDGTFPAIGRSLAYRFGNFQLLSQVSLRKQLPANLQPAQVRSGLTAVIKKIMEAPSTFDKNGWLRIGLYGSQPSLGETYISTGSLYLCSAVFLPLGLPASDDFWAAPAQDWSSRKIWRGDDTVADKALKL
ncbi:DUF2264 domain-containing protein [soil metagenome]